MIRDNILFLAKFQFYVEGKFEKNWVPNSQQKNFDTFEKKKKNARLVQESVCWRPQMGKSGRSEARPKPLDTHAC